MRGGVFVCGGGGITGPFICYINVLLLFKIKLFINKNHCFKYVFTLVETCKQNKNRMRSACAKCENVPNACQGVKIWVQVLKMAKIGTFWAFRIIMSQNRYFGPKNQLYITKIGFLDPKNVDILWLSTFVGHFGIKSAILGYFGPF